jgi:GNAT superfamily N-acetyltransferase
VTSRVNIERLSSRPDLAEAAADLVHATWPAHPMFANRSRVRDSYRQRTASPGAPFALVALGPDGDLLGAASVKQHEIAIPREREWWLGEVVVAEAARGRSLGTRLIQEAVTHARAVGIRQLYLFTPDRQSLYARLGWQVVEQVVVEDEPVTIMVLDLPQPQPPSIR